MSDDTAEDPALAHPPRDGASAGPPPRKGVCAITGRVLSRKDLVPLTLLRPSLAERFMQKYPGLTEESLISRGEVARLRATRVE